MSQPDFGPRAVRGRDTYQGNVNIYSKGGTSHSDQVDVGRRHSTRNAYTPNFSPAFVMMAV